MRNKLLIVSFLAIVAMTGHAQTREMRYGIKMGPTFGWASSGSTVVHNKGAHLGGNVGLVVDRYFTNSIAFSSGLNFDFMRMKYEFEDARMVDGFLTEVQLPVERRVKSQNLEVPLKVKIGVEVLPSIRAYVEAGASLGFNLTDNVKDRYEFYNYSYFDEVYVDRSEQYRMLQASLLFGLGTEMEVNRNFSLFAQFTVSHGLANAFIKELERKTGSILSTNFVGVEVGILY